LFYKNDDPFQLYISTFYNGINWTSAQSIPKMTINSTTSSVSLCVFENAVYMAYEDEDAYKLKFSLAYSRDIRN